MYNFDGIIMACLGALELVFGSQASPFLAVIGAVELIAGIYLLATDRPKVLDQTEYKRRFMTDNGMAYISTDKKKTKGRLAPCIYLLSATLVLLGMRFCHQQFAQIMCGVLLVGYVTILSMWFFRGDMDMYWMPGENRPIRIFYNEDKFKSKPQ